MVNKNLYYLISFVLFFMLLCCSDKIDKSEKILSRINGYQMTLTEFEVQLAQEMEFDNEFKLTTEAKKIFLEELIRKELLIQEAKKINLDRREHFMQAIERYWESMLIRDLLDLKAKEIIKKVYVSEKEITTYYNQMYTNSNENPTLEEVREKIKLTLKEEKKSRLLKEWIDNLRETANIEIDMNLL